MMMYIADALTLEECCQLVTGSTRCQNTCQQVRV